MDDTKTPKTMVFDMDQGSADFYIDLLKRYQMERVAKGLPIDGGVQADLAFLMRTYAITFGENG